MELENCENRIEGVRRDAGSIDLVVGRLMIYCDEETLKSCRLVNKLWLGEANKRLRLYFDMDVGKRRKAKINRDIVQLALGAADQDHSNFRIAEQIPSSFRQHFGLKLKSLELTTVVFEHVEEFRKTIFSDFPVLEELFLDRVLVKMDKQFNNLSVETHQPSTLRKLLIACTDRLSGVQDVFDFWGFAELFGKFRQVKVLTYDESSKILSSRKRAFFDQLCNQEIRLTHLAFSKSQDNILDSQEERISMQNYLTRYGSELVHVGGGYQGSSDTVSYSFQQCQLQHLTSLSVAMNLESLATCDLLKTVQKLTIHHKEQTSLEFLVSMPNLKHVHYVFDKSSKPTEKQFITTVAPSVEELVLDSFLNPPRCVEVLRVFPNVKKVRIVNGKSEDDMEELLTLICNQWPEIVSLKIKGPASGLKSSLSLLLFPIRGYDPENVSVVTLSSMATTLQGLEVFEYSCDRFGTNLCFGDRSAGQFLRMRKLRTLRLKTVSMSDAVIEDLKNHLLIFDFQNFVR